MLLITYDTLEHVSFYKNIIYYRFWQEPRTEHLAINFEDQNTGRILEGISFFAPDNLKIYFEDFNELGKKVLVHFEKNTFGNRENLRFRLVE